MMAAVLAETSKNKRVALYALVFAIKVLLRVYLISANLVLASIYAHVLFFVALKILLQVYLINAGSILLLHFMMFGVNVTILYMLLLHGIIHN